MSSWITAILRSVGLWLEWQNVPSNDERIQVYLAPADSDAEGTDAVVSETDGEGEKVALKRRARSRYLGLLKGVSYTSPGFLRI